ncbi:sugar transferase [Candidatus Woesearchaeota archaeon]|nr:sugar transferase [Candidatus Woesearchaeota archaeon]
MGLNNVLYSKEVLGLNRQPFTQYKIRTMRPDADRDLETTLSKETDGFGKLVDDPRITPWGKYLRKYWLDELPQLYNLLKGDMALIGVRPRTEVEWTKYPENLKQRALQFRPGLIGVNYSNADSKDFRGHLRTHQMYLRKKRIAPLYVDMIYFFRIIKNILFEGVRSR